ncbi:SpaH/EbpB family LPXTG-anchored major pilin [Bariatricus sp. HCP28S3_C2]|uniref:SpaH/EbpB family LPXTG-anchored major pilin n=1 Tax=unclassified Bariatricus TaxID=2677046 RepID=UPI003F890864
MKHIKKFVSLLLTLVMVLAMAGTTFAAQQGSLDGGSITINDAVPGQTYNAYQILYLESYSHTKDEQGNITATGAYAYKANSAWKEWLKTQTSYVTVDDQGYVTWVGEKTEERVAEFAKLAQAEATKTGSTITPDAKATAPAAAEGKTHSTVTFSDLKLGYYLVDTSLGTLCSLDTTNPNVEMYEKNEVPVPEKKVQEDSDKHWGDSNTAQIGDTVNFKTTITAKKGAQNYVLHDKMSQGLTLIHDSISVEAKRVSATETERPITLTEGKDYSVRVENPNAKENRDETKDGCDFEIVFTQDYLDTIQEDTVITVTYKAILNENAVISTNANTNETKLNYGEESKYETDWKRTDTYTFMFDIIKTDSNGKVLNGAKFELYDAPTGGNKIALVKEDNGDYHVATDAEKKKEGFTPDVIEAGKVTVKGLDANTTYWLEETEAPAGYNKLSGRVEVKIEDSNLTTNMTGDTWVNGNSGVHIINNTGAELPSTGGMGTTIFYIIGSVLVLAAVVLLIVRKRMSDR